MQRAVVKYTPADPTSVGNIFVWTDLDDNDPGLAPSFAAAGTASKPLQHTTEAQRTYHNDTTIVCHVQALQGHLAAGLVQVSVAVQWKDEKPCLW